MVFLIVLVRKNKTMCFWNQSQFDPIFSIGANEETNKQTDEQTNKRTNRLADEQNKLTNEQTNKRRDKQNKRIDKPLNGKNRNSLK